MGKKDRLVITRKILEVTPLTQYGGAGIYDVRSSFTVGKNYRVFGIVWFQYPDRSGAFCYLVEDDFGSVSSKAMNRFRVQKVEGEK